MSSVEYVASLMYIKKVSELPSDMMPYVEFRAALDKRELSGGENVAIFRIVSTDSYHPVFLDHGTSAHDVALDVEAGAAARVNTESLGAVKNFLRQ